ncbi:hypothetical protein DH2020_049233 [Rehmannia glutinosa]|uniref:Enhanced disease resistance 4-like N-terminal domain-containing protein n=1 Tax=Rehmannia glutinosa TaxID=99300 RepID=A0ABR0U3E5_REHGL
MADAAKVRLVRCPKCENLLPELPDFSLYQCGGCGVVLKAKQKGILEDGLTEISDAVKGIGISEEGNIVKVSEVKMESGDNIEVGSVEKIHNEAMASNGSSISLAESTEALSDTNISRRGKERIRKLESFDSEYTSYSQGLVRNRNQPNNHDLNVDAPGYVNYHGERVKDIRPPMESSRSRPVMDKWGVNSNGSASGPARGVSSQMRFDDFRYHDEGQSSYDVNSYYEQGRYRGHDLDGLGRLENLENGRAELLRRLDELKDQISRSSDMEDKSKERIGIERRMVSPNSPDPYGRHQAAYFQEGVNKQPLAPDDVGPTYFNHPRGYIPYTDRYDSRVVDPYPKGGTRRSSCLILILIIRKFFEGRLLVDLNRSMLNTPITSTFRATMGMLITTSSCYTGMKTFSTSRRARACTAMIKTGICLRSILWGNNSGGSNVHPQQSLTKNSNDPDSENDGFNYHRPRKLVLAHRSGRGFIASASAHVDQVPTEIDEGSSGTVDENVRYWNDGSNSANMNTYSNDYDEFQDKFSPTDKKSNSGESEKQLDPLSSTSSLSDDERGPENILSAKLPITDVKSLPDPDLSPQECPDHSPENGLVNRFDKRNKSQRPEQERVCLDRTTSQQSSVKDAAVATEMDVSLNEFSNSCASQDSVEISKEARPKINKGGESFFAGLIKKSFRDFKKSNQGVEVSGSQVFVNGHFLPDRVVKKAEKLAGPIQPGEYW